MTRQTVPQDLMDQASSQVPVVSADLKAQISVASDPSLGIDERLEAFEDVLESEVGDTSLARARNLERESRLRQIHLKFEGGNPTGTQKDRIAFAQAMDALRRGFDTITVATCGNFGVAAALAASIAGLRCVVFIPANYHTRRVEEMRRFGATIERVQGDYEAAVMHSQEWAVRHESYDANPGGSNVAIQLAAYGQISYEIYDELRDAPVAVAIPVSNGTTLAGMYRGFVSLYRRGKTSRIPYFLAGSSFRKNPIVHAWKKKLDNCTDLPPEKIHETSINEPLINWHSIDGDLALDAIRKSGGFAADATDRKMASLARVLREREGLNVLPASVAGLAALLDRHEREPLPGDRYVAVLTGRR